MIGCRLAIVGLLLVALVGTGAATDSSTAPLGSLSKEQGNGSRFKMHHEGSAYDLQVGLIKVDATAGRVVIEVFAAAQLADPLWQQFLLSIKGARPTVEAGYIQVGNRAPMKLPKQHLSGVGHLDVSVFLLSEAELQWRSRDGLKWMGRETVTTPAGTIKCSHYRVERPEQTLDFWISDEARPIGLVRLVSAGRKSLDNYKLELEELLSGIGVKIDPSKAAPLSDDMKALLERKG